MDTKSSQTNELNSPVKFNFRSTLFLILFWMLAVLLYKVVRIYGVEAVIENGVHQGTIELHIVHILAGGIVVGLLFGILEWVLYRSKLSKKSYLQIVTVKLTAFFLALFIGIIIGRLFGQCIAYDVPLLQAIQELPEFLVSPLVIPLYLYAIIASFAITFMRQVEKKFGTNVLFKLLIGKYFKARDTELAEAKEYLEFQVQERTKALKAEIAHREQTEKDLRLAKEHAESANIAKSQFLANMSHEIRTPLNAIIGFSQILQNQSKQYDLSADFVKYLNNIRLSGQHLSELINDILDLSKIEAGKMTLSKEDMNLRQLVQSVYHINKTSAKEKDVHLNYDFATGTPQFIHSDRSKLKQILMNVLSNAIKFTPDGKRIFFNTSFEKNQIKFQIKDEGIGIEKEKQLAIFDPFVQADTSVTRRFGGTGLGLSITKNMVDLLGGNITLESQVGEGSVVTISIPYQHAERMEAYQTLVGLDRVIISKNAKILVVEDNPMNQEMIKAFFKELNHEILLAGDGLEGISMAKQYRPNIIFMDIHMPGMDGFETMQNIKETNHEVPIIALSADAFQDQQDRAIKAGFSNYITKPIQLNKMVSCLKKHLNIQKQDHTIPKIDFTEEERIQAISKIESLSQIPIYETEKLVEIVESLGQVATREWKEAILEIIYTGDGKGFDNQLRVLKEKLNKNLIENH